MNIHLYSSSEICKFPSMMLCMHIIIQTHKCIQLSLLQSSGNRHFWFWAGIMYMGPSTYFDVFAVLKNPYSAAVLWNVAVWESPNCEIWGFFIFCAGQQWDFVTSSWYLYSTSCMCALVRQHSASRKCILLQWAIWVALHVYDEDRKIRFVACSFAFLKTFYCVLFLHVVRHPKRTLEIKQSLSP